MKTELLPNPIVAAEQALAEHAKACTPNSRGYAPTLLALTLLSAVALFNDTSFAGKPGTTPSPPPLSSGTVVLDYPGQEGTGAENFGLTVAPSGAIYASGISYDSAWHGIVLVSSAGENPWSLVDQFPPPGRYLWFWDIAAVITSNASGNIYTAGLTYADDGIQPDQWYVRRSNDGGASWITVDDFVSSDSSNSAGDVTCIATASNGDVYVSGQTCFSGKQAWTIRKGVGGTSFSTVDFVPGAYVYCVFAHPTAGIFAVGSGRITINGRTTATWLVRRSTSGGVSWSTVESFQLQSGVHSIAQGIGADRLGNLYAVGSGIKALKGNTALSHWLVRKSADGGNTWSTVDDLQPNSYAEARQFACASNGDLYVVGVTDAGGTLRKSTAGTGPWTTIDVNGIDAHAIVANGSGNVFIGGHGSPSTFVVKKY